MKESRLEVLRRLLLEGELSTQDELRDKLEKLDYAVTQSTVSRDLRKLGAMRAVDAEGRTVYRLPEEFEPVSPGGLADLIKDILSNGSVIVIHTAVGSASLIARHLDRLRPAGLLGTLAGDDTVFVAPASTSGRAVRSTIEAIRSSLAQKGD